MEERFWQLTAVFFSGIFLSLAWWEDDQLDRASVCVAPVAGVRVRLRFSCHQGCRELVWRDFSVMEFEIVYMLLSNTLDRLVPSI